MIQSPLIRDMFSVARDEPEITSLLNTDMYKLMMHDFVSTHPEWENRPVVWKMKVRSKDVHIADVIPIEAIREQFDAVRSLKGITTADESFVRGMRLGNWKQLLGDKAIGELAKLQLPEYSVEPDGEGGYDIEFSGKWNEVTHWEIPALKIVNTLYLYHKMKKEKITESEFAQILTEMQHRLYQDIRTMREQPDMTFMEFGSRRAASTDYQRFVFEKISKLIPDQCVGTSNVMIAREFGSANPKWTNAHEPRGLVTALEDTRDGIVNAMYWFDREWIQRYPGLGILLPDTYGTTFYFKNCPQDILENHNGCRHDSKDPLIGIPEYVAWLKKHGRNPQEVASIPSDGLDARGAVNIYDIHKNDVGKLTFGIGTNWTNNSKGTWPRNEHIIKSPFGSFSVVCKPDRIQRADGTWVSWVKLSDNPEKGTGSPERLGLFKNIFGEEGVVRSELEV